MRPQATAAFPAHLRVRALDKVVVDTAVGEGLATLERVKIRFYRSARKP